MKLDAEHLITNAPKHFLYFLWKYFIKKYNIKPACSGSRLNFMKRICTEFEARNIYPRPYIGDKGVITIFETPKYVGKFPVREDLPIGYTHPLLDLLQ